MTDKIENLTTEQAARLPEIRDEWLEVGLSTEPADRPRAEAGVAEAYRAAGMEPPKVVIWLDSPMAGAIGAQLLPEVCKLTGPQVWDQVGDQVRAQVWAQVWDQVWAQVWDQVGDQVGDQVRDQVWAQVRDQVWAQVRAQVRDQVRAQVNTAVFGQHEAAWLGFYDAFGELGLEAPKRLHGLIEVAKSAGWWWPFEGAVILTDRPDLIERDNQGRLHSETGMAIRYRDGWGFNAWHGVPVPDDFFTWDAKRALAEKNSEVRRSAIERIGWDNLTERLKLVASCDDPGNPGQKLRLYDLTGDLRHLYDQPARILVCSNASLDKGGHRRVFGLPVPAHHDDPISAAADLFGVPAAAYRGLTRAS